MKGTTMLKLLLDVAMCVIYLMLMFAKGTGDFFHEAAGIGIGILFIIHLILNRSMTRGLVSGIKKGSARADRKLLGILDIILCVGMPVVIVTGILIAKELFVINSGLSWRMLFTLHNVMSYVCLGAIALHTVLHGKYLAGVCKKITSIGNRELKSAVCRFGAGAAAMVTLYSATYIYLHRENDGEFQAPKTTDNKIAQSVSDQSRADISTPSDDGTSNKTTQPVLDQSQTDVNAPSDDDTSSDDTVYSEVQTETSEAITENVTLIYENDEQDEQTIAEPAPEDIPTLEEYLGNLHCTGCNRSCSLLNPRCGKGQSQAEQAQEDYLQMYGS